ncbi:organic hydroperoxide resistance protein [Stappia taiwanensis]|uniref:Organic hydroperoxide resistance protein n=1 Tax=Stappia taiwanensis TaxID=992267 RepID=A0A838XS71_9HYPH|nr:organic hydroperoxide resistance protein [Stappia taiwanensis]MBA4611508.1 organic hydroperoxide resistance protein [Stappia taiwanensis]GGE99696.1 OsmC family protein [Stappia taiwanensis]
MSILYTARTSATGGRTGTAKSDDGRLEITLSTPKELGGDGGAGTNPEQLFAAGYSACFIGALGFVAGRDNIELPADTSIDAEVGIGPREDGGGFGIAMTLNIALPGLDKPTAEALIAKADVVCPYSHATRGNVPVTLNLV